MSHLKPLPVGRSNAVDLLRRMGERSTMKQISVTAIRLLTPCLLAAGLVSFYTMATAMNVQTDSIKHYEFSAQTRMEPQRPQIRVRPPAAYPYPRPEPYAWPGPGAVRRCVDWYATEYRPSGSVITPQMRCRWVRGY
jgi:hypothetical protein